MRTKIFTSLFLIISLISPRSIGAHEGTYPHTHYPAISAEYNSQIIYDEFFRSKGTMTEATIQQFFVDKGSALATYKVPSDGSVPTTIGWDFTVESKNWSAAKVVYESAQWYDINPQVLLATLNKESSLVTSGTLDNLRAAMGYACPESNACNPFYYGFARQMDGAAYQFMHNFNGSETLNSNMVGIYYRGNTITLDGKSTYISNSATASLYRYTPHRPDSAQYYDSWGNIVTSHYYGNYNFISFYYGWFENWDYTLSGRFYSGANQWNVAATKFMSAGDFNGDGKDDIAAMYDYGSGRMGIWTFTSNGTSYVPKATYVTGANQWNVAATKFMSAGDQEGDNDDDIFLINDLGGDKIEVHSFISNGLTFTDKVSYRSLAWRMGSTKFAESLNFSGVETESELSFFYDYGQYSLGILGLSYNPN